MGKSPGKWIKTVLFGKKSSKSNLSKHVAITERKASMGAKTPSGDLAMDSLVISDPLPQAIDTSGETLSEKGSSVHLHCEMGTDENTIGLIPENGSEFTRQEEAAAKVQAAFRGYLARRAFRALKGIIRLQALVRGHLVRRQAVATLRCMRAIVEFQAMVRGRRVRLSGQRQTYSSPKPLDVKQRDLLEISVKSEKLSTNAFATKLLAPSSTTMPLSLQYDPNDPNSAWNWLQRWSSSTFWKPLARPKKIVDVKPKRKTTKLPSEETESGKSKRTVRRVNGDNNGTHSSEAEKSKRNVRKVLSHQSEPVQDQPPNELEKVKRSLRKISQSVPTPFSEKSEAVIEKPKPVLEIIPSIPSPDVTVPVVGINDTSTEVIDSTVTERETDSSVVGQEAPQVQSLEDKDKPLEIPQDDNPAIDLEITGNDKHNPTVNEEQNSKDDQTSKENSRTRRKSLPAKQDFRPESVLENSPTLPSYMAATASAKAKLRAQGSSPRTVETDSSVVGQEAPQVQSLEDKDKPLEIPQDDNPAIDLEITGNDKHNPTVNEEQNSKDDQTSKENSRTRRKSLPAKQDFRPESVLENSPTLPSYMAATASAKAKLRAQGSSPRTVEDGAENGFTRRHSLPSTNGKLSLMSPRVQKPVQANGKGGSKSNKSLATPKDEKIVQGGWKR